MKTIVQCPYCGTRHEQSIDITKDLEIINCWVEDGGCDKNFVIKTSVDVRVVSYPIAGGLYHDAPVFDEHPMNMWIDWTFTAVKPFPLLKDDPLVHVRFADGSTSENDEKGAMPISYWHDNGSCNNFDWTQFADKENQIVAYIVLNPNDHD